MTKGSVLIKNNSDSWGFSLPLKTVAETTCTEKRRMLELEDTLGGS